MTGSDLINNQYGFELRFIYDFLVAALHMSANIVIGVSESYSRLKVCPNLFVFKG